MNEREEDIKETFQSIMPHISYSVKKVCLAYNIHDYIGFRTTKTTLAQNLTKVLYKLNKSPGATNLEAEKNNLLQKIKFCDDSMDTLERDYEKDLHQKFCGVAFVSFNKEEGKPVFK